MRPTHIKATLIAAAIFAAAVCTDTYAADTVNATVTPVPTVTPAPTVTQAPATPTPAAIPTAITPTPTPMAVKTVDLVIFAGQSNMSGRGGDAKSAPGVPVDTGYEFRIGTCPTGLYPVTEPFGVFSNGYLCDLPILRGGSLVSSFMNSYYKATGVPVMGFSAARGGSSIGYWQTAPVQAELSQKFDTIKAWCSANHIFIRRKYVVWLQGETDGVARIEKQKYRDGLVNVFTPLFAKGLDQVFVITIGQYAGLPGTYDQVIQAEIELCASDPRFSLGSDALRNLPATYLTDGCHYSQAALNIVGSQCGSAAALYSKARP